jgi:DNA-binding transcriptional LysR family regulator
MKNNLNGITEFVYTVDSGTLTAAANKLRVSKAHISRNLSALEDRLGIALLQRTTRKIALTEFGAEYYERCRAALAELDAAETAAIRATEHPSGTIRITVAGAFGEMILAPIVAQFLTEHPACNVELYFTSRVINLLEEQFDIAFRVLPENEVPDGATVIFRYKLVTCASPGYFAQHGTPTKVSDLNKHNCLRGTAPYWRFAKDGRLSKKPVKGNWRSNNGRALVTAAKNGLGIIQVPDFYLKQEIANKQILPILEHANTSFMTVFSSFAHKQFPPLRVQMFHDYVNLKMAATNGVQ